MNATLVVGAPSQVLPACQGSRRKYQGVPRRCRDTAPLASSFPRWHAPGRAAPSVLARRSCRMSNRCRRPSERLPRAPRGTGIGPRSPTCAREHLVAFRTGGCRRISGEGGGGVSHYRGQEEPMLLLLYLVTVNSRGGGGEDGCTDRARPGISNPTPVQH